jgi:uncharacterized membrane protein YdjX (TVP38/TMEM64 family)
MPTTISLGGSMTLRLSLLPFFLFNMISGLMRVSHGTYVIATAMGVIPGSFVFAYGGGQVISINSLQEIASPNVLLAFTFLGLLTMGPISTRRSRTSTHDTRSDPSRTTAREGPLP